MANSSKRRSSCRSRDGCDCHTYEYIGWHADHFIEPDEIAKITVVLHDVTAGVTLERRGKIYNLREPVIFIDSLHRCQNVLYGFCPQDYK
jgi:hypothetical protein